MPTIAVLGIDAADYELVKKWDCTNLQLDVSEGMETYADSLDVPATIEVWPTIATGLDAKSHGLAINSRGWDSTKGLRHVARIAEAAPDPVTEFLRTSKRTLLDRGDDAPTSDQETIFDDGFVKNWPGITATPWWDDESEWFSSLHEGEISIDEFYTRSYGNSGELIGWLAAMSTLDVPIVGAHIHTIDHMGHVYAERPEKLREAYEDIDALVGMLRDHVDKLVIVSDHGMQTTTLDDESPGEHSFRAMVATNFTDDLPESVFDVAEWLESHKDSPAASMASGNTIDAPEEHLRDLGYL